MLFNEKLLAGEPIEYGLTDPPEPPSAPGPELQKDEKPPTLSEFFAQALGRPESDPLVKEIENTCRKQEITAETLLVASKMNCLFDLLDRLGVPLGRCISILRSVANLRENYKSQELSVNDFSEKPGDKDTRNMLDIPTSGEKVWV